MEDGSTSQWKKTMKSLPLSCRATAQSQTSVIIFIRSSSSKSRGLPTTNCNYLTDCSLPLQSFAANLLQETDLLLMCFVKVHTTSQRRSLIRNFIILTDNYIRDNLVTPELRYNFTQWNVKCRCFILSSRNRYNVTSILNSLVNKSSFQSKVLWSSQQFAGIAFFKQRARGRERS